MLNNFNSLVNRQVKQNTQKIESQKNLPENSIALFNKTLAEKLANQPTCQVKWEKLIQQRDLTRLKNQKELGSPNFNETLRNFEDLAKQDPELYVDYELALKDSSIWQPKNCANSMQIAVIVCYRDRLSQLQYLLYYLYPLLKKQQHTFSIYVIEQDFRHPSQAQNALFNRAKLFNVGYAEAIKENPNFNCFTFHDVDLILENENVTYACNLENPRHLSSSISKFHYKILPNVKMFGGVSQMTFEQFNKVNGYSNHFWGWGGEDDQMFSRLNKHKYWLVRPGLESRWTMISHAHESTNKANPNRKKMVKTTGPKQWAQDGISTLKYQVLERKVEVGNMFTNIKVDIFAPTDFEAAFDEFLGKDEEKKIEPGVLDTPELELPKF